MILASLVLSVGVTPVPSLDTTVPPGSRFTRALVGSRFLTVLPANLVTGVSEASRPTPVLPGSRLSRICRGRLLVDSPIAVALASKLPTVSCPSSLAFRVSVGSRRAATALTPRDSPVSRLLPGTRFTTVLRGRPLIVIRPVSLVRTLPVASRPTPVLPVTRSPGDTPFPPAPPRCRRAPAHRRSTRSPRLLKARSSEPSKSTLPTRRGRGLA